MANMTISNLFSLEGRVALVTGASSGLGRRFAEILGAAGAEVIVTARRIDRLTELADELSPRAFAVASDLALPDSRRELVEQLSGYAAIDVLINNAGVHDDCPLEDQELEELERVLNLNLLAAIDMCRLCAPKLFASSAASVINVASMYGIVGAPGPMAAYSASKGGLVNFTRNLASQWGRRGVRVNALCPGYFPSDQAGDLNQPQLSAAIRRRTLLKRPPAPAELDGPLLFLASSASSYVTGHSLVVDGGWVSV
jgi:hypothetical protein